LKIFKASSINPNLVYISTSELAIIASESKPSLGTKKWIRLPTSTGNKTETVFKSAENRPKQFGG